MNILQKLYQSQQTKPNTSTRLSAEDDSTGVVATKNSANLDKTADTFHPTESISCYCKYSGECLYFDKLKVVCREGRDCHHLDLNGRME